MVVGESGTLSVELIEMGSFDEGMSVTGEVSVALVIGHDVDDIRLLGGLSCLDGGERESQNTGVEGKMVKGDFNQ